MSTWSPSKELHRLALCVKLLVLHPDSKKMQLCRKLLLVALLLGPSLQSAAQSPFAPKVTGPLSQRVVAYQIDAKYDPAKHTVDATETLTYHNLTGQPLDRFPFHLYLNALSAEVHLDARGASRRQLPHQQPEDAWKPEDYGSNDVTSFEVVGMGDLTKQMKFVSPDDGNPDDKTVFQVKLPRPSRPARTLSSRSSSRRRFPR